MVDGTRNSRPRPNQPRYRNRNSRRPQIPQTTFMSQQAERMSQHAAAAAKCKQLTSMLNRYPKLFKVVDGKYEPTDLAKRSNKAMSAYSKGQPIGHLVPAQVKLPADGWFSTQQNPKPTGSAAVIERAKKEATKLGAPTLIVVIPFKETKHGLSYVPTPADGKKRHPNIYTLREGYTGPGREHTKYTTNTAIERADKEYFAELEHIKQSEVREAAGSGLSLVNPVEGTTTTDGTV